jgi:hypothetical protein
VRVGEILDSIMRWPVAVAEAMSELEAVK